MTEPVQKPISAYNQDELPIERRTFLKLFYRQLSKSPLSMGSLVVLILLYGMMVAAPLINDTFGYDPFKSETVGRVTGALSTPAQLPSADHWFGTDQLGRDIFSRVVLGSRISLNIGLLVALVSIGIGVLLGAIAGIYGGLIDTLIMRFTDIVLNFPFIFFAITIVTILEPSFWNIVWAIALLSWTTICRIVRANILSLREQEFFLAARSIGVGTGRIIMRHLVPNTMAPIIVNATLAVAGAILAEAGLSYLGLGVQPPTPSWGNILLEGKNLMRINFYHTLFPGLFIFATVMCVNFLGDGLRDALDPKLSSDG
jgi:peptide/nickel transport system permease protein